MSEPRDILAEMRDAAAVFADAPMAALLQRAIDAIESARLDREYMTKSAAYFAAETERLLALTRRLQMQVNELTDKPAQSV